MTDREPTVTVVRHERAIDELLWHIYVYLVDPQAVITAGEPQDKPIGGSDNGQHVHD